MPSVIGLPSSSSLATWFITRPASFGSQKLMPSMAPVSRYLPASCGRPTPNTQVLCCSPASSTARPMPIASIAELPRETPDVGVLAQDFLGLFVGFVGVVEGLVVRVHQRHLRVLGRVARAAAGP